MLCLKKLIAIYLILGRPVFGQPEIGSIQPNVPSIQESAIPTGIGVREPAAQAQPAQDVQQTNQPVQIEKAKIDIPQPSQALTPTSWGAIYK